MINTIIIEDEKLAAKKLERVLAQFQEINLMATLHSVEESLFYLKNNAAPDLIFSDIVLGDGLSFDIFEEIKIPSFIIYTTAFDQYTLRAFKLNSIDYLLKPIEEEEVKMALDKFKSYPTKMQLYHNIDFQKLMNTENPMLSRIVSKVGHHLKIIPIEEVSYFYSENKIVYAQTKERAFPTEFTLDKLMNVLDSTDFFRVNRQIIIQLRYIKNIRASAPYQIEMEFQDNQEITVSRERIKDFKNWIS